MRRAWLALMLLTAGALARPARANPGGFTWSGPDCDSSSALLERRLGELLEPSERERLAGRVSVVKNAGNYSVELSIDLDGRPLGLRRFAVTSCADAAETAAVAASLAVYQGPSEPEGAAGSGISPDIWTGPEPTSDLAPPPPTLPENPTRSLEARLGLLGSVEIGALPQPAWGGALELELGVGRRWSFALLGSVTASQRRSVPAEQSVHLSMLSGTARACVAPLLEPRVRLDGCTGARLTQARGRGQGFDVSRTGSLTWLAPLFGLNLSVRAPSYIEWRAELDAAVPLSRQRFLADGDEVARANAVVAAARLGVVSRF